MDYFLKYLWRVRSLNFGEHLSHDVGCIKEPGPDLLDPGSLQINLRLSAVLLVHGAYAPALVREGEFRSTPAAVLALLLRQWGAALYREGLRGRKTKKFGNVLKGPALPRNHFDGDPIWGVLIPNYIVAHYQVAKLIAPAIPTSAPPTSHDRSMAFFNRLLSSTHSGE
jgi:hypothetical protein